MIDLKAGCASKSWTVQLLGVGKGHPPRRCFTVRSHAEDFPTSSCASGRQEAGAYDLETPLGWAVVLARHFCCQLKQPRNVFRPVLLHVLIKCAGGLLQ